MITVTTCESAVNGTCTMVNKAPTTIARLLPTVCKQENEFKIGRIKKTPLFFAFSQFYQKGDQEGEMCPEEYPFPASSTGENNEAESTLVSAPTLSLPTNTLHLDCGGKPYSISIPSNVPAS